MASVDDAAVNTGMRTSVRPFLQFLGHTHRSGTADHTVALSSVFLGTTMTLGASLWQSPTRYIPRRQRRGGGGGGGAGRGRAGWQWDIRAEPPLTCGSRFRGHLECFRYFSTHRDMRVPKQMWAVVSFNICVKCGQRSPVTRVKG